MRRAPLGGTEAHPTLQLVELLLALGALDHRRARRRKPRESGIAQERLAQRWDLVEIELIGMAGLGVARSHRPDRLQTSERSLDLGPIGPGIDLQPGIVVGNHRRESTLRGCRSGVPMQSQVADVAPPQLYKPGPKGSNDRLAAALANAGTANSGMVQMQVTPQGWLGSTPEGRRPQVRGFRTGGSLAFARSTPATQLLPPSSMLKLNHAQMAARFKTHCRFRRGFPTPSPPATRRSISDSG